MKSEENASAQCRKSTDEQFRFFAFRSSFFFLFCLFFFFSVFFLSACANRSDTERIDRLNCQAYSQHYRNLDSVARYCAEQQRPAESFFFTSNSDGEAQRLNNLAFYYLAKMDYATADRLLSLIPKETDNQIELLIGYVQQMRLCQRRSRNKDFYDYREKALTCLQRINEERSLLTADHQRRLLYAETELAIVTSTYYYYVGLEQPSIDALSAIDAEEVKRDTAQFLNYLYNIGAGGILTQGSAEAIFQQEMDCLLRCYQIARRDNYPYFVANALEAIAEHLINSHSESHALLSMVNPHDLPDDSLAIALAEESLRLFQDYGDAYQMAGAFRTLASCHWAVGNYDVALYNLQQALADSTVMQAPDLVASIYEQLSVVYAAIDDKPHSDYYRNLYLDLQELTRQDRQLEARADQLSHAVSQLNIILWAVVAAIVLLLLMLWLFRRMGRRQKREDPLHEQLEEQREQLAVSRQHLEDGQRRHLEQRAKISLVNSLLPLIDRMVYTINRKGDRAYVRELIDKIERDNDFLTQWIQLRQGQLSLRIESFPLQQLFDIIARSQKSFQMRGITLSLQPTSAVVKADRILTLFMLNTLADNARKFTPAGGQVSFDAAETPDYVEISVNDTGVGMTEEELSHVFDRKAVADESLQNAGPQVQHSHGFGLLNCRDIIDRYRKMSALFSVCTLQAESQKGRGSRFFFRLPKGVVRPLVMFCVCWLFASGHVQGAVQEESPLSRAAIYADSAYFSNINGTYERTLLFADSCRHFLNEHYRQQHPHAANLMMRLGDTSILPPEIQWLHDSVNTNYSLILDIRNESAVAALALHEWSLYQYNNRIYTQLYKELSADNTLADYCRTMQQTKENRTVAVVILTLALLAMLPLWYFFYLRPRINARLRAERISRDDLEALSDEQRRTDFELQNLHVSNAVLDNCLSTLKHETMYYPSRIRQLIEQGDMDSAREVVVYYRELYNLLSQQAMSQVERVKLHLQRLDHDILGDPVLIGFLFDNLRRITRRQQLNASFRRRDSRYVEVVVETGAQNASAHPGQRDENDIPRLLCRQIVRDHGDATNRHACSFREEQQAKRTIITIILPAYGKLQGNHS